jgi:integrase
MLQVRDVNMIRREIRIRPEVAKTNNARTVPITSAIMAILEARDIYNLPPDYYIFSSNNFKPGTEPYHPNTPTNWWRKLVIIGLGIDCKMYSLKHKGADDKIESGISLEVLRSLYGHKSYQMTEIYAKAVREKHKQQIIDNSPAFAKVVQMKRKVV